jgi:hypothetical protein
MAAGLSDGQAHKAAPWLLIWSAAPILLKEILAMKIVVKAEKAGKVVARSEREVTQEDLRKTAQKAFARLWQQKPNLSLFDHDLLVRFEKN